ncbi:alpha/beta hydrolase [Streptacidiphilus monticola]
MSLTGTPFFLLTVAFLIAATVALLLLWNRVPGPGALRWGGRTGLALLSQFAAVVMVLVYVNNSMGPFYESWADLFGDSGQAQLSDPTGEAAARLRRPDRRAPRHPALPSLPRRGGPGRGGRPRVPGPRQPLRVAPPQYQDPAYANTDFPVVELLSGFPGSPQTWFGSMAVGKEMTALMAQGKVQPMILVAPTLNVLGNTVDAGCADIPGVARTATWLARDVPALVAANFRTQRGARHWGVMGYSAGAYCAVNLAVHYPGVFHAAVSLSGYNAPSAGLVTRNPALARANNPYLVLRSARKQPDVVLLMAGSLQDGDTVAAAKALLGVLRHPGASRLLTVAQGGHLVSVWHNWLPVALPWLSAQVR